MTMIRVEKNRNYTHMSNYHFLETELSAKATGILSFMMSLPDDWDYSVEGLATRFSDGKDSIKAGLKELERFGYLQRNQSRDEKGHVGKMEYVLYEIPNIENRQVAIPEGLMNRIKETYPWADYPSTVYPSAGNPIQDNTNTLNTNKENTNQSIGRWRGLWITSGLKLNTVSYLRNQEQSIFWMILLRFWLNSNLCQQQTRL